MINNPLMGIFAQNNQQPNMANEYASFRQNPLKFLVSKNINIPQEYLQNPQGAVQYLLNTGQMTQEQLNRLSQMAQTMGVRLA